MKAERSVPAEAEWRGRGLVNIITVLIPQIEG